MAKLSKIGSVLRIAASSVLSVVIAMAGVEYGAVELGALVYMIVPLFIGIVSTLLFLYLDYLAVIGLMEVC